MKRIALICMALVLALGALGVGYAAWTDELYIQGTVNTGSVDLEVLDYSGTWVYKMYPHGYDYFHGWVSEKPVIDAAEGELVAWAEARPGGDNEADIVVEFSNIFPCQPFMADFLLHYTGSVPARLYAEITDVAGDSELLAPYVTIKAWRIGNLVDEPDLLNDKELIHRRLIDDNLVDIGVQVHFCDLILVAMYIDLPQLPELMDLDAKFAARIQAIQWNKYTGEWYPSDNTPG